MSELLGGGKKVYLPKRKGEPDITYADISKIKKYLGWKPQIKFENGVMEMINNLEYWSEAPLWEKSSIEEATKIWHKYMN